MELGDIDLSGLELELFNQVENEETKDDCLMTATRKSLETGKITPLLKEELRCRIQTRRLSEGKSELVVTFDPTPPVRDKLSSRDMERMERRREQNRRAARKLRQKKQRTHKATIAEFERLGNLNNELKEEIFRLSDEKLKLQDQLLNHFCNITEENLSKF